MIEFLSLYLGLVWGIQPLHLRVEAPVARVEIRLDDRPVAILTEPPWSVDVDFGDGPLPSVLVAEAWDRAGEPVARIEQVLNLPRPEAEASLAIDRSGDGMVARLSWQSLEGRDPTAIEVKLDGEPIAFQSPSAIDLPEVDPDDLHVLEAEVVFSERSKAYTHLTFGAEFADATWAGLTAIPVQLLESKPPQLGELGEFFRDARDSEARYRAIAIERGPADLLVVRDRALESTLEAVGLQAFVPRRLLTTKWSRVRYLQGETVLDSDDRFYFLNATAAEIEQEEFVSELFLTSPPLSSRDASLFWASVRTSWGGREDVQQLADAVAVAGLQAARHNGRRAVLLLLSDRVSDRSSLSPLAARRFLRSLHVPLFVWRIGVNPELEVSHPDDWQASESLQTHQEFLAATRLLKRSLKDQMVAWIDGVHLPQHVTLDGAQGRLELSTAPAASLVAPAPLKEKLAAPEDLIRILLNRERAGRGLGVLRRHDALDRVAAELAEEQRVGRTGGGTSQIGRALIPALEEYGFAAERASESLQWGMVAPEDILDSWLQQERRGDSFAFDPAMSEIGVAVHRSGATPTVVVIFAESREHAFRRKTRDLDRVESVRAEMLDRVNQARAQEGLGPLALDPRLDRAAQDYADSMLERSFYGHVSPEGGDVSERIRATGYRLQMAAENLAEGPTTAHDVISAWLESPEHRRNILEPRYRETGFGLAIGKNDHGLQILWVQCLARSK